MKVELYKQSKSIIFRFKNFNLTVAIGFYSKKLLDFYEVKSLNKKVIQSRWFWICYMGKNIWSR